MPYFDITGGPFFTIVADPPWNIKRGPPFGSGGASRVLTYPTMSVDEITSLPVSDLANKDAHLYLWTINHYLENAFNVCRAWGFKPSTTLVWCKNPNGLGLGGTYSLTTEFIIFARRGTCPALNRIDTTWWLWKRGKHSQKPEAFQTIVEGISPPPRLELFARRRREGWTVWGNEI